MGSEVVCPEPAEVDALVLAWMNELRAEEISLGVWDYPGELDSWSARR